MFTAPAAIWLTQWTARQTCTTRKPEPPAAADRPGSAATQARGLVSGAGPGLDTPIGPGRLVEGR
ncbi:hypothetical protein EV646_104350 [Kribbella antiqua]|uniref:Uncharacterized protein n=1 Tax=Kribbella antiqua TaxID=2512217 RepID=A0A4R2IWB2_9ACTN|nr:hypothetical protein EV646_104350 [Kribbella antiqua]